MPARPPPRDNTIHLHWVRRPRGSGRASLLRVLAHHLAVDAATLCFVPAGDAGKPALVGHPDLAFNWSHSGDVALVAVSWGCPLGVDLEFSARTLRDAELAERFFDPRETALLRQLPAARRTAAFLRLWTAKEALIKAAGSSIAQALSSIELAPAPAGQLRIITAPVAEPCTEPLRLCCLASPRDDVLAALAWSGPARRIAHFAELEPVPATRLLAPPDLFGEA